MGDRGVRTWGWLLAVVLLLASAPAVLVFWHVKPAEARFEQVREGMTRDEVLAIMGPALSTTEEDAIAWNDGKRVFVAWFTEDVVTAKGIKDLSVSVPKNESKSP
jgi:hypothetical protein